MSKNKYRGQEEDQQMYDYKIASAKFTCKDCMYFTRRILPPDDLGICTKAEDFTPSRWQKESRRRCNLFEEK